MLRADGEVRFSFLVYSFLKISKLPAILVNLLDSWGQVKYDTVKILTGQY